MYFDENDEILVFCDSFSHFLTLIVLDMVELWTLAIRQKRAKGVRELEISGFSQC